MARPENPEVRRKLLASGLHNFYLRGVNATGVKDITEHAEVSKGTFYTYYSSKDDFVVAILQSYWSELQRDVGPLLLGRGDARHRLSRYFSAIAADHERHSFMLGCLLGNLALEVSATSDASRGKIGDIITDWEQQLSDALPAGPDGRRREVAAVMIEAWEGAVFRAKVDRDGAPYTRFNDLTLPMLIDSLASGS